MTSTVLTGISRLVTNDLQFGAPLGFIEDAALVFEGESVVWVGSAINAPEADTAVDLGGRCVLPGWVDSHSHLIFAGDRSAEFSARMAGAPYAAGGIMATVGPTRASSDGALLSRAQRLIAEMAAGGTTCVETKTGYGLTVEDEIRSARIARAAGVDEVTFLGAHLLPPEYSHDAQGYVDLVCGPMLEGVREYAGWIDVFCEQGAFDEAQSRQVLTAGAAAGLGLRVHGNQLGAGPGAALAVELGAASVDHCTYLSSADLELLGSSDTVATLLPACDLSTRQAAAPGRELIDAGATVALASNCNPGSSYTTSMALAVALAVLQCRMTAAEAIWAATAGGAKALRRSDVGHLGVGARADIHVLDAPSEDYLAYRVGVPLTHAVWRKGTRVR
ncbi:imidazolonepropionase [Nakamurella antarctica]|uniref:Imidazolonepropionase n=1 Tax=Nakamurella antarctica TaxID=1902245 RepID=A0A3G8ZJH6_9ACTN|nr:imidazolonepropionase [Nakamurella antarctica]AZI57509.1 imidazolonepropionase [Nakamurella antarctica]